MRSAGCIINDLADIKFDKMVVRTKSRPLASGELKPINALIFLAALLLCGLALLVFLPKLSIILGLATIPLIITYPFMKRITYYPQLFLGIVFNFGVLIAYSAATSQISSTAIILYIGCIFWTLGYDTIYAHQDKKDDILVGVKSTALALKDKTKLWVFVFYCLFLSAVLAAIIANSAGFMAYIFLALTAAHLFWQIRTLDINDSENCMKRFKANVLAGSLALFALLSAFL